MLILTFEAPCPVQWLGLIRRHCAAPVAARPGHKELETEMCKTSADRFVRRTRGCGLLPGARTPRVSRTGGQRLPHMLKRRRSCEPAPAHAAGRLGPGGPSWARRPLYSMYQGCAALLTLACGWENNIAAVGTPPGRARKP